MRRPASRLSGTLLMLGFAAAMAVGAIVAVFVIPDDAPASLQPSAELSEVETVKERFTDPRTVEVDLAVTDPTELRVNTSGVVTALDVGSGTEISSGTSPFSISGNPIVALHTAVPLYRDLKPGSRGTDVKALQDELVRLGYGVGTDGLYGRPTERAVQKLKKANGVVDADTTLSLQDFVWLPGPSATPTKWHAPLGSSVTMEDSFGVVPGQLTSVSVANLPAAGVPGNRTLTLWGVGVELDEHNRSSDPEVLTALAASADYTVMQDTEDDEQKPTATAELSEPLDVIKVPPTALFALEGESACIQTGQVALPVTVVGSALGASLVRIDGETDNPTDYPTAVRLGQGITETECR